MTAAYDSAGLPDALVRAAGADSVLSMADAKRFTRRVDAIGVIAPDSVDAVAAVMHYCSDNGIPVLPAGAGTWLRDPRDVGLPLILSTRRLCSVLEHEPADLVIGVGAGLSLEAMSKQLARHRQRLPLDPPATSGATVGAVIALGSAGPLRAGHGTPRDMVLGLEVVTGDGRVLRFGGRVVKNVAGYDGVRLFTGSRGALGIITSAFLRVRGEPDTDRTVVLHAADETAAGELARKIALHANADAVEVLGPEWRVLIRVAGSHDAVAAALAAIGPAEETDGAEWTLLADDEGRADTHIQLNSRPADAPAALVELVARLQSGSGVGAGWRFGLHAADGVVRAWRGTGIGDSDQGQGGRLLHDIGNVVASCGGTAICTLPGRLGTRLLPGPVPEDAAVRHIQGRLSAAFDPAGILCAGAALREEPT